jgi:hypothetical protein
MLYGPLQGPNADHLRLDRPSTRWQRLTMSTHSQARAIAGSSLRFGWNVVRLPLLAVLSLLAPVVQVVCGGLLLLGVFVSIAFRVSGAGAAFPFWHMIGISLGFAVFAILHYALIGLLSR